MAYIGGVEIAVLCYSNILFTRYLNILYFSIISGLYYDFISWFINQFPIQLLLKYLFCIIANISQNFIKASIAMYCSHSKYAIPTLVWFLDFNIISSPGWFTNIRSRDPFGFQGIFYSAWKSQNYQESFSLGILPVQRILLQVSKYCTVCLISSPRCNIREYGLMMSTLCV